MYDSFRELLELVQPPTAGLDNNEPKQYHGFVQSFGFSEYETSRNKSSPSLAFGSSVGEGMSSPLASGSVGFSGVSLGGGSGDLRDSDLLDVALLGSCDLCDSLDEDRCGTGDLREFLEVDLLGSEESAPQGVPLRAGTKVVVEPASGMEKRGGGVIERIDLWRCSSPSSLSLLFRRPSDGTIVVDPDT